VAARCAVIPNLGKNNSRGGLQVPNDLVKDDFLIVVVRRALQRLVGSSEGVLNHFEERSVGVAIEEHNLSVVLVEVEALVDQFHVQKVRRRMERVLKVFISSKKVSCS